TWSMSAAADPREGRRPRRALTNTDTTRPRSVLVVVSIFFPSTHGHVRRGRTRRSIGGPHWRMATCDEGASFLEHWARCHAAESTGEAPRRGGGAGQAAPGDSATGRPDPRRRRRGAAGAGLLACGAALAVVALGAWGRRRDGVRASRAGAALGALVREEAVPPAVSHACPGSVDVRGFGSVSVVAAQFHAPGVPGAQV
ncbi:unnamed protein product, partial [Prorocentrum cordatum]